MIASTRAWFVNESTRLASNYRIWKSVVGRLYFSDFGARNGLDIIKLAELERPYPLSRS